MKKILVARKKISSLLSSFSFRFAKMRAFSEPIDLFGGAT